MKRLRRWLAERKQVIRVREYREGYRYVMVEYHTSDDPAEWLNTHTFGDETWFDRGASFALSEISVKNDTFKDMVSNHSIKVDTAGKDKLLVEMENAMADVERNVVALAKALWQQHYQEDSPEFELLDSAVGVIGQIDNMCTGLVKAQKWSSLEEFDRKEGSCWIQYKGRVVMAYCDHNGAFLFYKDCLNCYMSECIAAVAPVIAPEVL